MNKHTLRREAEDTLRRYGKGRASIESLRLADFAQGVIALLNEVEQAHRRSIEIEAAARVISESGGDATRSLLDHLRSRKPREDRTASSGRG